MNNINPNSDNLPTHNQFARFRKYYTALEPAWDKPKNRVYTAIIFSFLAISLFGWYAIKPTIQTILVLQKEIEEKQAVNSKMDQKIENLIKARAALDAIAPQLYLIDEAVPNEAEALDLSLQLRNLINESSATIAALTVSQVPLTPVDATAIKTDQRLKSTDFMVSTTIGGGYDSFENVLRNINILRRLVSIQSMTIRVAKGEEIIIKSLGDNQLILSLELKSYYK
jgi:FtsZ-binding cell division protein ZapB